jgi:hypothetical protein
VSQLSRKCTGAEAAGLFKLRHLSRLMPEVFLVPRRQWRLT